VLAAAGGGVGNMVAAVSDVSLPTAEEVAAAAIEQGQSESPYIE